MFNRTFFVTASSSQRKAIFQSARMQHLFLDVLRHYRREDHFRLHAFVLMPNHFHLLITPTEKSSLEKCLQLIKGGYSFRAKKELGVQGEIWAAGYNENRVRSIDEFNGFAEYIHNNPVKTGFVTSAALWECSSAFPGRRMDPVPEVAGAKAPS